MNETYNSAAAKAKALKALADETKRQADALLNAELYPGALTDDEIEALKAESKRKNKELKAKLNASQFRAIRAAAENKRREELHARIAAREAKKKVTEMSTVTERADEKADKAEVAVRSEPAKESNVTPMWSAAMAVATIKRARADGYPVVTVLPPTFKHKSAGKIPARFDRGSWGGWKGWETEALTASLDSLLDWQGQTNSVANVGVVCGIETEGGYTVGVDIDCEAPEIVDAIAKLAGGDIAIRIGRPKRSGLIMLVVDELGGAEKFQCGGPEHTIQLLRTGKQFVCAGIHPDAKRPYRWEDTNELPVCRKSARRKSFRG